MQPLALLLRSFATIPDLIYHYSGIDLRFLPIFSFGFFVAMAFLVGAAVITHELKRRSKLGLLDAIPSKVTIGEAPNLIETLVNFIIFFVVCYKLGGLFESKELVRADPQGYLLSTSGSVLWGVLGGTAMAGFRFYEKWKAKLDPPQVKEVLLYPHNLVGDIVVVAAISGIIGSNVFSIFDHPGGWKEFLADPAGSLFSGLTIYGGLIFGILSLLVYCRIKNISVPHLFDALGLGFMLSYAVGRIGCQVSGDGDWGIANIFDKPAFLPEWLWRQNYAHNIIDEGVRIPDCTEAHCFMLEPGVFPTPIYETIVCGLLFLFLWSIRKKLTAIPGMLVSVFLVLNGIERFFIEKIRVNARFDWMGMQLTQAEIISAMLFVTGLGLIAVLYWHHKKTTSSGGLT